MKKALLGALSIAVILSMCAVTAFAASPGGGRYFTDADGDGICDVCGNFADADGDGICDSCGRSHWRGMAGTVCGNFADADGDGICDSCGRNHWRGCGRWGLNFVDADGDGICDNNASGQGRGCGRGCHGGRGR